MSASSEREAESDSGPGYLFGQTVRKSNRARMIVKRGNEKNANDGKRRERRKNNNLGRGIGRKEEREE